MNEVQQMDRRINRRQMTAIDVQVGNRIRIERTAKGMSQVTLASAIGVTFQQLQKYETGRNRVSAGRLSAIAEVLGVPASNLIASVTDEQRDTLALMAQPKAIKLLRLWMQIPRSQRSALLELMQSMARPT